MSKLRTRVELIARIRRDFHLRGQTQYADSDFYGVIDDEYAWCWEKLALYGPDSFGVHTEMLPTVAAQSWVALPVEFNEIGGLRALRRLVGGRYQPVERSSRMTENDSDPTGDRRTVPGVYWFEGPTSSAPTAARLELRPVPTGIENLEITYAQQAPVFTDDSAERDIWAEHVERLLVALVAIKAGASGDGANYQKTQAQLGEALKNVPAIYGRRDSNEPNWLSLSQADRRGGSLRYNR